MFELICVCIFKSTSMSHKIDTKKLHHARLVILFHSTFTLFPSIQTHLDCLLARTFSLLFPLLFFLLFSLNGPPQHCVEILIFFIYLIFHLSPVVSLLCSVLLCFLLRALTCQLQNFMSYTIFFLANRASKGINLTQFTGVQSKYILAR